MSYKRGAKKLAAIALSAGLIVPMVQPTIAQAKEKTSKVDLRIMATTDLHAHIMDHDYYTDKQDSNIGLSRVATLIEQARAEVDKDGNSKNKIDNSILVDNGDTIQGNPLATVFAMNEETKIKPGEKYPVYEALDLLGYDATTLGNHEFNYGLDFLKQITDKSVMNTSVVNANVYDMDGNPLFDQYKVINEVVIDENGKKQTIKIGLTGFVPPQILNWDKQHLQGKVQVEDIKTAADKVVKKLKEEEKVDIVIAQAHTGTGTDDTHVENSENAAYQLTKVEGLDVVIAGHSHATANTTMNGVQVVQPANWGKELGVVDLKLEKKGKEWIVNDNESTVERRSVKELTPANNPLISQNPRLLLAHDATVEFINQAVGTSNGDLNTFLSLVGDNSAVELVANAQSWYVENKIAQGQTELAPYADLKILSAAAPFKAGGRSFDDPTNFVDIKAGDLKIKDLSNLYIYDNTVSILKMNGAQVKEWLEMSAGMFNTIDKDSTDEQQLFNNNYRSYNFDTIEGVTYEIDITKPAKYDNSGNTINADSERIVNLQLNGEALDMNQEFLVVTNNYRAGGNFPGVRDAKLVYASADENRQAIMDYITEVGEVTPSNDDNWTIKAVDTDANVVFNSHVDAVNYIEDAPKASYLRTNENGMGVYSYNLK